MSLLSDPSMKEIVDGFCEESVELLAELEECLEELEDNPTKVENLEKFGQVIDRIMGAAKSVGAHKIATFCELGKAIGYKSSQTTDPALLEVVVAILFDAIEILKKMIKKVQESQEETITHINTNAFVTRLNWLQDKFKNVERSSVAIDKDQPNILDQSSIDDLMSSLGL